jgi:glutaredoxin
MDTNKYNMKKELNKDNIKDENYHKNNIIFIVADWCGHCQAIKDDIQKIKDYQQTHSDKLDVTIYKSDEKIPDNIIVEGYPTILINGEKYYGERTYQKILDKIINKTQMGGYLKYKRKYLKYKHKYLKLKEDMNLLNKYS